MKYVRTKDKIMLNDSVDIEWHIKNNGYTFANTIEELCDEYVIKNCICSKKDWELKIKELKKYILKNRTVYGAIWTEWGLKYVAKMNEKGEMELL